jgi:hypothetical protein
MERPTGFDIVQRPRHYNNHPSGVECIEIMEHMTANLANAFKYGWRGGLKIEDATQDYEKCLWYLIREYERKPILGRTQREVDHFRRVMSENNRGRRVFARPSPWCEPIRTALSYMVDIHCTTSFGEGARLNEQAIKCMKTALADQRCMGRGMEP